MRYDRSPILRERVACGGTNSSEFFAFDTSQTTKYDWILLFVRLGGVALGGIALDKRGPAGPSLGCASVGGVAININRKLITCKTRLW